jgi:translocator protein
MNSLIRWQSLIISSVLSFGFATAGALVTNLDEWYFNLNQPSWKPPDAAFGLIWSLIFAFCAAAAWLSWNAAKRWSTKYVYLTLYLFNGVLNLIWSILYFQLHRPDWSLWECFPLGLTVLALMIVQWKDSKLASILLAPYLVWICIAATLNWQTLVLNGF